MEQKHENEEDEYTDDDDGDIYLYVSSYDIFTNEIIHSCSLYPTQITLSETDWLWAINNKYDGIKRDPKKCGKWMIFRQEAEVNKVWDQIKEAIKKGQLWHSKVSVINPNTPNSHAIMIYTKDYTDKKDIIDVLNFLEESGIKRTDENIKYKTDQQTLAGIYSGGSQKPWIYTSNSIRGKYQCYEKRNPTEVTQRQIRFLHVTSNKYDDNQIDHTKTGKWLIFREKTDVDATWNQIKEAVADKNLWKATVSTTNPNSSQYIIMVYTKDYTDKKDVVDVLDFLEMSGIKREHEVIKYKTDEQTRAGVFAGGAQRPSIYASDSITQRSKYEFGGSSSETNWRARTINGSATSSNFSSIKYF